MRTLVAGVVLFGAVVTCVSGCQFAAGIANENESCPAPSGDARFPEPLATCQDYCTNATTNCKGQYYPDQATCEATCGTFTNPNDLKCRTASAKAECARAGAYDGCKVDATEQLQIFTALFQKTCQGSNTPQSFGPTTTGETLLLATEARYHGCTESADCLCKEVVKGASAADARVACKADYGACQTACKLPNWR